MNNMIELKSVGTVINIRNGLTYPINNDNTYDYNGETHLIEIDNQEWWDNLSINDYNIIETIRISING